MAQTISTVIVFTEEGQRALRERIPMLNNADSFELPVGEKLAVESNGTITFRVRGLTVTLSPSAYNAVLEYEVSDS